MNNVKERNFYSGTDSSPPYKVTQHRYHRLPLPPRIHGLINGGLVALEIEKRLQYLSVLVDEAVIAYGENNYHVYFFKVEAVLLFMRRVIDDLVMSRYCQIHSEEIEKTRKIEIDGYGSLFRSGRPTTFGVQFIRDYIDPNKEIADILLELSNSYKHSYLLSEARAWGADFPTVLAIYAPRNDYSKQIIFHNHSLGQLILGFNLLVDGIVLSRAERRF